MPRGRCAKHRRAHSAKLCDRISDRNHCVSRISPVVPSGAGSSQAALWFNPPKHWKLEGSSLPCTADPKTDFWRETFYGYVTYSGHLYYRRVSGDFTTQVKVTGQYHDLYGQAGLMVRIGAENWMSAASSS
jgi:hypothetical protein